MALPDPSGSETGAKTPGMGVGEESHLLPGKWRDQGLIPAQLLKSWWSWRYWSQLSHSPRYFTPPAASFAAEEKPEPAGKVSL